MSSRNANRESILDRSIELLKSDDITCRGYAVFVLALIAFRFRELRISPAQRIFWYFVLHNMDSERILHRLIERSDVIPGFLTGGSPSKLRNFIRRELLQKDSVTDEEWSAVLQELPAETTHGRSWEDLGMLAEFVHILTFNLSNQNRELLAMCDSSRELLLRSFSLAAIGANQIPGSFDVLNRASQDEDITIRRTAIRVLEKLSDNRTLDTLRRTLKDNAPSVRLFAAMALARKATPEAFHILSEALRNGDNSLRIDIIKSLGQARERSAVDLLINVSKHEHDPDVLQSLYESLAMIARPSVIDELVRSMEVREVCKRNNLLAAVDLIETSIRSLKKYVGTEKFDNRWRSLFGYSPPDWII